MTEDEMMTHGRDVFEQVYNGVIPVPTEASPRDYAGMSLKMFHDFWGDGRLSFRDKRLIVLGTIAGRGSAPSTFAVHAQAALRNGELTPDELRATVLMILPYVGYPDTSPLMLVSEELIRDHESARRSRDQTR